MHKFPADTHSPKQMSLVLTEINGLHSQQTCCFGPSCERDQITDAKGPQRNCVALIHHWPSMTAISADHNSQNWHKRGTTL